MNQFIMLGCLWLGACATAFSQQQTNGVNSQLGPIPSVHKPLAENSVPMGNIQTFEEVKLDLPITSGPYEPTWKSIESNYPGTPEWLRDSKFGIWIHFGPQSAGESGGKIGVCCYIKRAEESVRYTHSVVFILHWISINYGMPYIGFRFKIGACCYTCVKRYQTSIRNRSMLLQS